MASIGDIKVECEECGELIRIKDAEFIEKKEGSWTRTVEVCYDCFRNHH